MLERRMSALPQWDRCPVCETLWTRTRHWERPWENTSRLVLETKVEAMLCSAHRDDWLSSPERRHWWSGTWGSGGAPCSGSAAASEGRPGRWAERRGRTPAPRNTGSAQMATRAKNIQLWNKKKLLVRGNMRMWISIKIKWWCQILIKTRYELNLKIVYVWL